MLKRGKCNVRIRKGQENNNDDLTFREREGGGKNEGKGKKDKIKDWLGEEEPYWFSLIPT